MSDWDLPQGVVSCYQKAGLQDIHYLRSGSEGPIVVFIHGLPFSSYMWRSVMSQLEGKFRCFAPDLVGCGLSQVGGGDHNLFEQIQIFSELIAQLAGSEKISLIGHGLGTVVVHGLCHTLGDQVTAVGFYEGYLKAITAIDQMGLPLHHLHNTLTQEDFLQQVAVENFMLDEFLPMVAEGKVSEQVLDVYRMPFMNKHSREMLLHALSAMMDFSKGSVFSQIIDSAHALYDSEHLKKVLFYSMPGMVSGLLELDEFRKRFPNTAIAPVGQAMFLAPELNSEIFARAIISSMSVDA